MSDAKRMAVIDAIIWAISIIFLAPFVCIFLNLNFEWAPGLLDDGSHLWIAKLYEKNGFVQQFWENVHGLFSGSSRFYEVHYIYLGILNKLFGLHLGHWYSANFVLVFFTALFMVLVFQRYWGALLVGVFIGASFLSNSSLIEAARANFGKVECEQAVLLLVSLYFLPMDIFSSVSKRPSSFLRATFAAVCLTLFALSKESSKIVLLSFLSSAILLGLIRRDLVSDRRYRFFVMPIFIALAINAVTAFAAMGSQYLNNYFTLDFSAIHVKDSINFYKNYSADTYYLLLFCMFLFVYEIARDFKLESIIRRSLFLVPAISISVLLLGFRFQTTYYLYLVVVLLTLQLGTELHELKTKQFQFLFFLIVVVVSIGKLYSVPSMFSAVKAQRMFDWVNSNAINFSRGSDTIFIDVDEPSQLVQEWNILNREYYGNEKTKAYGIYSGFKAWNYQDMVRQLKLQEQFNWAKWVGEQYKQDYREIFPKSGDMLFYRYGRIYPKRVFIRAASPYEMYRGTFPQFPTIDLELIKNFEISDTLIEPWNFRKIQSFYGFDIYRIKTPLHYFITDLLPSNKLSSSFLIIVENVSKNCKIAHLEILKNSTMGIPYLKSSQKIYEPIILPNGNYLFSVDLQKKGQIPLSIWVNDSNTGEFVLIKNECY